MVVLWLQYCDNSLKDPWPDGNGKKGGRFQMPVAKTGIVGISTRDGNL